MRLKLQRGWPFLPWQQSRDLIARDPNRFGRLYAGGHLVGSLMLLGYEHMRRYYMFIPSEGYEAVRWVFETYVREQDHDHFRSRCEALNLRLVTRFGVPAGMVVTERIRSLRIDGHKAVIRQGLANFPDNRERYSKDHDPDPSWQPPRIRRRRSQRDRRAS